MKGILEFLPLLAIALVLVILFESGLIDKLLLPDDPAAHGSADGDQSNSPLAPIAEEDAPSTQSEIKRPTFEDGPPSRAPWMVDLPALKPTYVGNDGKAMRAVDAGYFWMGDDEFPPASPARWEYVDAFYMDESEVTVAEYRAFVIDGAYFRREIWSKLGWASIKNLAAPREGPSAFRPVYKDNHAPLYEINKVNPATPPSGVPAGHSVVVVDLIADDHVYISYGVEKGVDISNYPIMAVTYYEAEAYARWCGKKLPTEKQWEKAARGDSDTRGYPWGDSYNEIPTDGKNGFTGVTLQEANTGLRRPLPVGSYQERSPYGIVDLVGNVQEWCRDIYADSALETPEDNATTRSRHSIRGADFLSSQAKEYHVSWRRYSSPSDWSSRRGFRCVLEVRDIKR